MQFTSKTLICIVLIALTGYLQAQTEVSGSIYDNANHPIPYANVLILKQSDSSLVKGGMSDFEGVFKLKYNTSEAVFASIQYMGFKEYNFPISINQTSVTLNNIKLETSALAVSEVVVKFKRPLYEQKIDRTIVNVQSSVTNAGNTALNVLAKSPSVTLNRANGQINLQGKSGVLIMINDKEVRMEMADLINLLDGMPAANIKNIELITTPPASYDAQGVAGIININLIENSAEGFMGRASANVGYARKPKYGGSFNLNFKKGKLYSYANVSASLNHRLPEISLYTDYQYPTDRVISDMKSSRDTYTALYNADVGLNYDLSQKTSIGGMVNFYNRNFTMDAIANTETISERDGLRTQKVRSDEVNNLVRTLYNVYLQHNFTDALTFNIDYDFINFYRSNPTNYHSLNNEGTINESENKSLSLAETPLKIHVLKADFDYKLTEKVRVEAGAKYTLSGFENSVRVALYQGGEYVDNPDYTRIYTMNEEVYAVYTSIDWQIAPKLFAKSGIRYENYNIQLNTMDENLIDDADGKFFPNLSLNYTINDRSNITASYAQRIQRPGFMQLAPYFYFFNNNTLFTGNPNLVPSNSTQYKVSYSHKKFIVSADLTHTHLPIFNIQPNYDEDKQLAIFGNSQGVEGDVYSLSFSVPWQVTNKWSSNFDLINYYRDETTAILGHPYEVKSLSANFNMNHSYELSENLMFELNFMYNTPYYEGAAEIQLRTGLDLGIQYKFKNSASLAFNVEDVYNKSSGWPIDTDVPEYGLHYQWKWASPAPVFRLNFSMPLGNHNFKTRTKRNSGAEEELKRL